MATIKVYEYNSDSKERRETDLTKFKIILVTYETFGNEYKLYSQKREGGLKFLIDYNFRRIILD